MKSVLDDIFIVFGTIASSKDSVCFFDSIFQLQLQFILYLRRKPVLIFSKYIFFQKKLGISSKMLVEKKYIFLLFTKQKNLKETCDIFRSPDFNHSVYEHHKTWWKNFVDIVLSKFLWCLLCIMKNYSGYLVWQTCFCFLHVHCTYKNWLSRTY